MEEIMEIAWALFVKKTGSDIQENLASLRYVHKDITVDTVKIDDKILKRIRTSHYNSTRRAAFQILEDKLEGPYRRWHSNGKLWLSCEYKNGKHNGIQTESREDGSSMLIFNVRDGVIHGKQEYHDKHNNALFTRNYRYGELHGDQIDINLDGTESIYTYDFGKRSK
ncbi:MAG: hypothetical protein V1729_03010 [Candidatus Woesearchaeota archaeon]